MNQEYPSCSCATCQEALFPDQGPRKACLLGHSFTAVGKIARIAQ